MKLAVLHLKTFWYYL